MQKLLIFLVVVAWPAASVFADAEGAAAPRDPRDAIREGNRPDLGASERKVFSQFGEDGVIERIFEIIEPGQRFVVEFGAYDAIVHSNSRNLVVNHDWSALLIEGNQGRARRIAAHYPKNPKVKTLQEWVYPGNVEILFEENDVPMNLDLLVIDIDSNDYYVWRAIHEFRPKVVLLETNIAFPPPQLMVIDFHPMNYWDNDLYVGASLQSYSGRASTLPWRRSHQQGINGARSGVVRHRGLGPSQGGCRQGRS